MLNLDSRGWLRLHRIDHEQLMREAAPTAPATPPTSPVPRAAPALVAAPCGC